VRWFRLGRGLLHLPRPGAALTREAA
jgi:hypothetical protein